MREQKKILVARQQATPYQKQRSALEMEFSQFLESTSKRAICPLFGEKSVSPCVCRKRLDSIIGKLRALFNKYRRSAADSLLPANPAASTLVKSYLSAVSEEQLVARVMQRQAEPIFLQDLVFLPSEIAKRTNVHFLSSTQLFVLARDQASLRYNSLVATGLEISVE